MLGRLSALTSGRRTRWAVIGVWAVLAVVLAPLQGPLQEEAADESDTFLVRGSESAEADRVIEANFRRGSEMAAVITYFRDGGITSEDRVRINADGRAICQAASIPALRWSAPPTGCRAAPPTRSTSAPARRCSRHPTPASRSRRH